MDRARASIQERPAPRPKGLPLVGSLPAIVRGQYRYLEQAFADEGPIFELDLGLTTALIVADTEAAEAVLVGRARNYDKGGEFWDGAREQAGLGLTMSEGELWRRQRRLMQPKFQREAIESYRATIEDTVRAAVEALPLDTAVDFAHWSEELISVMAMRVLLGSEVDPALIEQMRHAITLILESFLPGMVLRKLPRWLPRPGRAKLEQARELVDQNLLRLIAETRERGPGNDLLSELIHAADEFGAMSDRQLLDEAILIFGAGYETTGSALAWTLWSLARHGEIQARVHAELDAATDPRQPKPLLHACIQEGLRLYPPAALLIRRAVDDDVLGGYVVRGGTPVLVSPWLIHRDPKLWPRPETFEPERFLAPSSGSARPRMAWIPFGAGQRICIGKALALLELERALDLILTRARVVVADEGPPPEVRMATTIRPSKPILLSLQARTS